MREDEEKEPNAADAEKMGRLQLMLSSPADALNPGRCLHIQSLTSCSTNVPPHCPARGDPFL
jgi:hypothetical protein